MAHSYKHSISSARQFGGIPEDYLHIHQWFDATKASFADVRHRALRHHSEGIFWCEEQFGPTFKNSEDKLIYVRQIGEQHVKEDLGEIPTAADWLRLMDRRPWMMSRSTDPLRKKQDGNNGIRQEIKKSILIK